MTPAPHPVLRASYHSWVGSGIHSFEEGMVAHEGHGLVRDYAEFTGTIASPVLSVVVPAFNEAGNLSRLLQSLIPVLGSLELPSEVIFVDDGSTDGTWSEVLELHERYPCVRGIRFSRNFGHQYAILAGLSHAKGGAVICMDADLQHPPEVIPSLVQKWRQGYEIVHTVREDNADLPALKKATSALYYRLFSALSGVKMEKGMADFRLFDRRALNSILRFSEQGLFLRGMVQWVGFRTSTVRFRCGQRYSGQSKYTLRKMLSFACDGLTSFSLVPLRVGIVLGIGTSFIAFLQMTYAFYSKVFLNSAVPGWATTVMVMSFMFGMLFFLLGLLGEYLGRILIETRGRPRFIIWETVGSEEGTYGEQERHAVTLVP